MQEASHNNLAYGLPAGEIRDPERQEVDGQHFGGLGTHRVA